VEHLVIPLRHTEFFVHPLNDLGTNELIVFKDAQEHLTALIPAHLLLDRITFAVLRPTVFVGCLLRAVLVLPRVVRSGSLLYL